MHSKTNYIKYTMSFLLIGTLFTGCNEASIDDNPTAIAVFDDINGNADGIPATAAQLNAIPGVSAAKSGTSYAVALAAYNYADSASPTAQEIQAVIDAVNAENDSVEDNATEDALADLLDSRKKPTAETYADAGITGVDATNIDAINQALKDDTTGAKTAEEIQAIVDAVNVVVPDKEAPVITLIGTDVNISVNATYTDAGATALDGVDGDVTANIIMTSDVDTATAGTYTVTYDVNDTAGNDATQVTRSVTVNEVIVPDAESPVITLTGADVNISVGSTYTDAGATALDDVDGDVTANIIMTSDVDTAKAGTYTVTYDVNDTAGNDATQVTRTVTVSEGVVQDTTPPVITLEGNESVTLDAGDTYIDAGAAASDDVDGDITSKIVANIPDDIAEIGLHTITYDVNDTAGNAATQVTRTVNVEEVVDRKGALKFLRQAAFTSKETDITAIIENGYEAWIDAQLAIPSDLVAGDTKYGYLESTLRFLNEVDSGNYPTTIFADPFNNLAENVDTDRFRVFRNHVWWHKSLRNEDQLRQKVTYALSQILVTSNVSPAGSMLTFRGGSLAYYYDILQKHAFGNYRELLKEVTLSPTMGYYLTYIGNKKTDLAEGTAPDENYAREVMQLFTIGLKELNMDGTTKIAGGKFIPTYTQDDVVELSKVFTGWHFQDADGSLGDKFGSTKKKDNSQVAPLRFNATYHEMGAKTVLGQSIPAGLGGEADIDAALDILYANQNVAPYISRHLIMRLVTSNPSPAYVGRVAAVFESSGGKKGDLKAVVKAILLDDEARGINAPANFGKVDEMLTVFTRFLDVFHAKPVEGWKFKKDGKTLMVDKFYLNSDSVFRQGPMSSPSVFNFYSPDFIPADPSFSNSNTVSPELEIQNTPSLIGFSNIIAAVIDRVASDGGGKTQTAQASGLMYLDLAEEFNVFEMALDGDTNGDFVNMKPGVNEAKKEEAVIALIDHLDTLLLGTTMPTDFKDALKTHLMTIHKNNNTQVGAKYLVNEAVRAVVTSPLYMIMK